MPNPLKGKNIDDEKPISFKLGDNESCNFSKMKSVIIPGSSLGGTDPFSRIILAYVNSGHLQIDYITVSNTNYGFKIKHQGSHRPLPAVFHCFRLISVTFRTRKKQNYKISH